jgi:hypothetical protein
VLAFAGSIPDFTSAVEADGALRRGGPHPC